MNFPTHKIVILFFLIKIAVPGQPANVQGLCTVVAWQLPLQPNGVIVGYDLEFLRNGLTVVQSVDAGATFYLTSLSEQEDGTSVRVSDGLCNTFCKLQRPFVPSMDAEHVIHSHCIHLSMHCKTTVCKSIALHNSHVYSGTFE